MATITKRKGKNGKTTFTAQIRIRRGGVIVHTEAQTFPLTVAALTIIERQQRNGELIFPYNPRSVGASFARACKLLGIEDLHFHDLRHEATSRLFEAGYSIPEVAQFTLHQSWKDLQRYTNLRPAGLVLR
jgi:integrase